MGGLGRWVGGWVGGWVRYLGVEGFFEGDEFEGLHFPVAVVWGEEVGERRYIHT